MSDWFARSLASAVRDVKELPEWLRQPREQNMIRKPANTGDTIRILVPNMDTGRVLVPGTVLRVTGHIADQPSCCMVEVEFVPAPPLEYNIVVPKGSRVNVHEE